MKAKTSNRTIYLTPPTVSAEHIKEKIICIRAHKERIFEVSMQLIDGKLICHNYGQGGAGWTFLFGCVHESLRQFEQELAKNTFFKNKPIAIIGAGCYGLLTAISLSLRGYTVRIIAKDIENISSTKAAGFFFPRPRKSSTHHERTIFEALGIESYKTYLQIINGTHPFIKTGPKLLPGYYGLDIDPGFAPYISKGLIEVPEEVTIHFGNDKIYQAREYKTIFINSAAIIDQLQKLAQELHILITNAGVHTFSEIEESIIFNCAGLGTKELTGDKRLIPVQGHLITLKNQPDKDQLQYMINMKVIQNNPKGMPRDELIYYAPKEEGILGITFIRGQDSLTANQHEFDRLIGRCQNFFGT